MGEQHDEQSPRGLEIEIQFAIGGVEQIGKGLVRLGDEAVEKPFDFAEVQTGFIDDGDPVRQDVQADLALVEAMADVVALLLLGYGRNIEGVGNHFSQKSVPPLHGYFRYDWREGLGVGGADRVDDLHLGIGHDDDEVPLVQDQIDGAQDGHGGVGHAAVEIVDKDDEGSLGVLR